MSTNRPPSLDSSTVEALVRRVLEGQIRIPDFQRGLKWKPSDVCAFYDSLYRGYPVGALLLHKAPAPEDTVRLGPLEIEAPETPDALWVIDGQQRLVSLAAGLARSRPAPVLLEDPYVVYFDAANRVFESAPKQGVVPTTWVPVSELLDATELTEWVFNWAHGRDADLRKAVFDAGTRIRQYEIPQYIVEVGGLDEVRKIFLRINNRGVHLEWGEIHDAMLGRQGESPSRLSDLARALEDLGMGRLHDDQLLSAIVASRGLDVTQNVSVHYDRDPELLEGGVRDAQEPIRKVLLFLRQDAEIPHVRLLPISLPIPILTRFFVLHPEPNARARTLLTRWTWRVLLGSHPIHDRTLLRRGVGVVAGSGAEDAARALLTLTDDPADTDLPPYEMPPRFDARESSSRLALLGMSSLGPLALDPEAKDPLDVAELIEDNDGDFRRIAGTSTKRRAELLSSPANRVLLPGSGLARKEILQAAERPGGRAVLASHGITASAVERLTAGDVDGFLRAREEVVEEVVTEMSRRLAGLDRGDRDRLSIRHALEASAP